MPGFAGRRRPLIGALLLLTLVSPTMAWSQQPAPGTVRPGTTSAPPTTTPAPTGEGAPTTEPTAPPTLAPVAPPTSELPQPIPVIPDPLLIPPLTIPSVPQRYLPAPTAAVAPTARFQFLPTIGFSEEYTDNFNLTERNKVSNYRSTISPGLSLSINSAFVKGLVGYTFSPSYDTATDDISMFHSLIGNVAWDVTPLWKLTLADTFTKGDQPEQANSLGLRRQRQEFTSNILSLSSDYLLGTVATRQSYVMSKFSDQNGQDTTAHTLALSAVLPIYRTNSLSAGYEYLSSSTTSTGSNSTSVFGLASNTGDSDVTGHKLSLSLSRKVNSFRSYGVIASYALRSATSNTQDVDFQVWNAQVFHDYELTNRLKLHTTLGVSGVNTDSGQSSGPSLSTQSSLVYQFAKAILTVAADKGVSETFTQGENFGLVETEGARASLSYPFTPSITGTVDGYYRHNKETGIGGFTTNTTGNGETKSWGGSLTFSWQILRTLLFTLTYTYTKQTGDTNNPNGTVNSTNGVNDSNYTENHVKAAFTLSF